MDVRLIKIDDIVVRSKWNIRDEIISETLHSLIESIQAVGLQNPITINNKFELVAGYRRLCACRKLGFEEVPVHVQEFNTVEHERLAHIDENLQSKSLSPKNLERALSERKAIWIKIYPPKVGRKKLDDPNPKSFERETADMTGQTEDDIRRKIRRVDGVSESVRTAYEKELIKQTHIDELLKLPHALQDIALQKIMAKNLTIAETRLIVLDLVEKNKMAMVREAVKKFNSENGKQRPAGDGEVGKSNPSEDGFIKYEDIDVEKVERSAVTKRVDNHVREVNKMICTYFREMAWKGVHEKILADLDVNLSNLEANVLALRAAISAV